MSSKPQTKVLVSSAVYQFQELLDQVYGVLVSLGCVDVPQGNPADLPHEDGDGVLPSGGGGLRSVSGNSLRAMAAARGTPESDSITHEELKMAIRRQPAGSWLTIMWSSPKSCCQTSDTRRRKTRAKLKLEKKNVVEDLRVIDMLELAMRKDIKLVKDGAATG